MANERIKGDMNISDVVTAMTSGNPGALTACMEILTKGSKIDPDDLFGGFGAILTLDTLNIWNERIYMLWSDVCGRDTAKTIAILRAYQLGQLAGVNKDTLQHAIDNRGKGIDLNEVIKAVKKLLPNFNIVDEENNEVST